MAAKASRKVVEFNDKYGLVLSYLNKFDFEDKEEFDYTPFYDSDEEDVYGVADPHKNILKYLKQIRESFGFDVDCRAPSWFEGPFYGVNLSEVKVKNVKRYDEIIEAAKFAIDEINADAECGKTLKYVDVEKAVLTVNSLKLLTIKTKEEDGDATKDDVLTTIQAIVYVHIRGRFELEQWRVKPVPVAQDALSH